jgi:UDP-N-acetylmuramoyl-tripeptide--D-alanyl-D-alanine ligase
MDPIAPEDFVTAIKGHPLQPIPFGSIAGVSTDSRSLKPGDAFFALAGQRFDGHDYVKQVVDARASVVVASRRDVAEQAQAANWPAVFVDNTVAALGRLAGWYRKTLSARLVAVTGSNGKTTTKTMLEGVLSAQGKVACAPKSFNNNIGVPLTLLAADRTHDYLVLELGTNHLGEIAELAALARPDLSLICSIGPAHMAGLGDLEGVAREKTSLLDYMPATGFAAVNIDEPIILPFLRTAKCKILRFGTGQAAELRAEGIESDAATVRFKVNGRWPVTLQMVGRHNAVNALGAWAVASRVGMLPEQIADALGRVRSPDMRFQRFQYGSLTVINDAYNANPASMAAALRTLADIPPSPGGRRVAVLADMLELGAQSTDLHRQTGQLLAQLGVVDCLIAVGPQSRHLADAAATESPGLEVHRFMDAPHAAARITRVIRPGDLALLKGSRGMCLESVLPAIQRAFGEPSVAALVR